MEIVIFEGLSHKVEEEIQEFLNNNPEAKIRFIKQSTASNGEKEDFWPVTTISIWYEYPNDEEELNG